MVSSNKINVKIEVLRLIEPNPSFGFAFSNTLDDVPVNIVSDMMSQHYSGKLYNNKNLKGCRISRVITKGFPYEVVLKSNQGFKNNDLQIWHQIGKDELVLLNNVKEIHLTNE